MNEENLMSELLNEYDVKRIKQGDILKGKIIEVTDKEVMVNIDYAFDGMIIKEEYTYEDVDLKDIAKVGDVIDVFVISPNDGEGYVLLSRLKAVAITAKQDIKEAYDKKTPIKVVVKEEVKGGVVAYYEGIRIFIPGSQLDVKRVELNEFVGKTIEIEIIELDLKNNKIVGSRRIIEQEKADKLKEKIWKELKEGEKREGTVVKIVKFGAFVDIGGVQGLIHLNDLSWERVFKAEDVVKVGDKVEVIIGSINQKDKKLSLILKDVEQDPWKVHGSAINEGKIFDGKVTRLSNFGAFVEILPGIEGLVHISEITDENIAKPSDVLEQGQNVKVKVLNIDLNEKKLSLSIKEAVETDSEYQKYNDNESGTSLADIFSKLNLK